LTETHRAVIPSDALERLIEALSARGYRVLGPRGQIGALRVSRGRGRRRGRCSRGRLSVTPQIRAGTFKHADPQPSATQGNGSGAHGEEGVDGKVGPSTSRQQPRMQLR
jgi:hypothetical protein